MDALPKLLLLHSLLESVLLVTRPVLIYTACVVADGLHRHGWGNSVFGMHDISGARLSMS